MKLIHPDWTTNIEFSEGGIELIQIESPAYFSIVLQELLDQKQTGNGRFILSDDNGITNFSKSVELILSPFALDFGNRKIVSEIFKRLMNIAQEEEIIETHEITGEILKYIYRLIDYERIDITLNDEIDLQQLLKAAGVRAAIDETDVLTRLTDYIFLIKEILNIKLVICANLQSYFSKEQMLLLKQTAEVGKISLLLLQSGANFEIIDRKHALIIDADLCEI